MDIGAASEPYYYAASVTPAVAGVRHEGVDRRRSLAFDMKVVGGVFFLCSA